MDQATLQLGGGLLESAGQVAAIAASLLIVLMLVALGAYAYKHLRGGGIEWPDDEDPESPDGVVRGGDDDEWEFY